MTKTQVMRHLRAHGSAQTRKTYRRHGIVDECFGVSYAELGKLRRKIKTDQALAEQLWATGNYDARVLATMVADPSQATAKLLDSWARDVRDRGLAAALSNVAAEAPSAQKRMEKWTAMRNEMRACAGWHTLASLARQNNGLDDAYFAGYIDTIERTIHDSPNWARYAMNNALINIGVRNPGLQRKAIAAAQRIGTVDIDHGETSCKTPDAVAYIKKTVAHRKQSAAKKKAAKKKR